jgi:ribosome maturation protein SDO1
MSARINQAIGQVRLTNVAIVRLKVGKRRFEIACYPSKVLNWREGVETDISEVLQLEDVYTNVTRGMMARKEDLVAAFGTSDRSVVCLRILKKGVLQVSGRERQFQIENKFKEIANIISEKCIDTTTGTPFTVSTIEKVMKEKLHFAVNVSKNSKSQALEAIPKLAQFLPIARSQMKIRFSVPSKALKRLKVEMEQYNVSYVEEKWEAANECTVTALIPPGAFRVLSDKLGGMANQSGGVEVLELSASSRPTNEGFVDITDISSGLDAMGMADNASKLPASNPPAPAAAQEVPTPTKPAPQEEEQGEFAEANEAFIQSLGANEPTASAEKKPAAFTNDDFAIADFSKPKKKKKKKKKGRKQTAPVAQVKAEKEPLATPEVVDLCGYIFEETRGGWLLKPPLEEDIVSASQGTEVNSQDLLDDVERIRRNQRNSWKLFGEKEKPAMWNQKLGGWLVHRKFGDKLDLLGAIQV